MSDIKTEGPFNAGEIVYLKSGSPDLTVVSTDSESGVKVTWQREDIMDETVLPDYCLQRERPDWNPTA